MFPDRPDRLPAAALDEESSPSGRLPIRVAVLAGGVGAGKFLRGVVRGVAPEDVTVVVNTGDDIRLHGLHVSPDLDSVTYWLAGVADRERGWGRAEETFRVTDELREFGADGAWFALGDLDLATHLHRTELLRSGRTLSEATSAISRRFRLGTTLLPMTEDAVRTHVDAADEDGGTLDLHFQVWWVARGARDHVKSVRYEGATRARPSPGVLDALREADVVLLSPSNPVVSIGPILAVPGIRDALVARRESVVGISPIVGGTPLRGMADRLLPAVGVEVSAAGVASLYRDLLGGWVIDRVDAHLAAPVRERGTRVAVTDTIMVDDDAAEALAREAILLALTA